MPVSIDSFVEKTSNPFASWKVDHAGIRVPSFEEAATWYETVLDFRIVKMMPLGNKTLAFFAPAANDRFLIEFIAGEGCINRPQVQQLQDSLNIGGWHHLCFEVDELDSDVAELRRRSVRIVHEPQDNPILGRRFAFFSDPWGNLFELTQPIEE